MNDVLNYLTEDYLEDLLSKCDVMPGYHSVIVFDNDINAKLFLDIFKDGLHVTGVSSIDDILYFDITGGICSNSKSGRIVRFVNGSSIEVFNYHNIPSIIVDESAIFSNTIDKEIIINAVCESVTIHFNGNSEDLDKFLNSFSITSKCQGNLSDLV